MRSVSSFAAAGFPRLAAAVLLAAALGACASDDPAPRPAPPPITKNSSKIRIPKGAGVEGSVVVPAGATANVSVTNKGPGRVNYVLRKEGGAEVSRGGLTVLSTDLGRAIQTTTYVLLLEADADAQVVASITIDGGVGDISWNSPR